MADKLKKFGMKAQAKGAMLTASVKGKMKKDKSPTPADGEEATEGVPEVEVTEPQQSAPDEEGYTSANEDTEHPDRPVSPVRPAAPPSVKVISRTEYEAKVQALETQKEKNQTLINEKEQLAKELAEAKRKLEEVERDADVQRRATATGESALAATAAEKEQLESIHENEKSGLAQQHESEKSQLVEAHEAEKSELNTKIHALEASVAAMTAAVATQTKRAEAAEDMVKTYRTRGGEANLAIKDKDAQITELTRQVQEKEEQHAAVFAELGTVKALATQREHEAEEMKQAHTAELENVKQAHAGELECVRQQNAEELERLRREHHEQKEEIQGLYAKLKENDEHHATALREKDGALTQAHREKDEALTQARSKEEEADQARRDKDELASNYQTLNNEYEKLNSEHQGTSARLSEMEGELQGARDQHVKDMAPWKKFGYKRKLKKEAKRLEKEGATQ